MVDYEKVKKWTRIMTFIGSAIMIALGIAKFFNIMTMVMHSIDYIVNIYLILLGVFFILYEIPIQVIVRFCLFFQKFLGKFLFSIFLGLLCFDSNQWFTLAVGVVWWVISLAYLALTIVFCKDEMDFSSFDSSQPSESKKPQVQAVEIGSTPKP